VTDQGNVINTINYEPVGILLTVTPHINPDGFVRMEVSPTISSIADSSVQISEEVNAIVINSRSAQTTVTVQDGHTIVLGGLIRDQEQNREEKVPLLGDIPLLGALFKSTKVVRERTELLIIMTPRVLRTPSDGDVLTNKQLRQLHLGRGIYPDSSIGDMLNPLRGVTPREVKRLEGAGGTTRPAGNDHPVVIPLRLSEEERRELLKQARDGGQGK